MEEQKLKCDDCGKISADVSYRADPYSEEISGKIIMKNMCDSCYQESSMDI